MSWDVNAAFLSARMGGLSRHWFYCMTVCWYRQYRNQILQQIKVTCTCTWLIAVMEMNAVPFSLASPTVIWETRDSHFLSDLCLALMNVTATGVDGNHSRWACHLSVECYMPLFSAVQSQREQAGQEPALREQWHYMTSFLLHSALNHGACMPCHATATHLEENLSWCLWRLML